MKRILLILPILLILIACNDKDDDNVEASQLNIILTVQDNFAQPAETFTQGEDITFVLTVENTADSDFNTNYTPPTYNFLVKSNAGEILWAWTSGRVFVQAALPVNIPAGGSIQYTETWSQVRNDGSSIGPGEYTVEGLLYIDDQQDLAIITIQ